MTVLVLTLQQKTTQSSIEKTLLMIIISRITYSTHCHHIYNVVSANQIQALVSLLENTNTSEIHFWTSFSRLSST